MLSHCFYALADFSSYVSFCNFDRVLVCIWKAYTARVYEYDRGGMLGESEKFKSWFINVDEYSAF